MPVQIDASIMEVSFWRRQIAIPRSSPTIKSKKPIVKTQSEVDVLTLRLNQQQEELNVSLEYQKNIRKEFAELSIKTDHQIEHLSQMNNTKHD